MGAQQSSTQTNVTTTAQADTQVTTFVQQIDAQGPVVVERITTQFADVACSPDNARKIVEALHTGTAVTLSADGKTATFTPSVNLGYGEAYIAMALAAEALRGAGVTGCATPEQWQAVLMGGPLAASGTTTTSTSTSASSSSSSHFPGIIALRTQGQGWGQIAQSTNVQLGQVVSSARSSFQLGDELVPTGQTGAENRSYGTGSTSTDRDGGNKHKPGHGKAKGHDKDRDRDRDRDRDEDRDRIERPNDDTSATDRSQSSSVTPSTTPPNR